jgi:hypothetical protein
MHDAVYEVDPAEFGPPPTALEPDEVGDYVANGLAEGRRLFDVLADSFVMERVDEYVSLLDHVAREPAVRAALDGGRPQDRREQAREAGLEVFAAQRVEARGSLGALVDHAGLSKDPEVMGAGRLRDRDVEARARSLAVAGCQRGDDLQAHGVAERMQDRAELDVGALRMSDLLSGLGRRGHSRAIVRRASYI